MKGLQPDVGKMGAAEDEDVGAFGDPCITKKQ
jgi:hypothetical protein